MSVASDTDHTHVTAQLSFDGLPFSDLFKDYCRGSADIWSFFKDSSIAEAEARALDAARERPVDRQLIRSVLEEQNRLWDCDAETLRSLEILEQPGSVGAVTGQQLGIFVSPLYTMYKAITAINLARKWRSDGVPAAAIFWLADEDHDFEEVASTYLPAGEATARVGLKPDERSTPVGRRVLDDQIRMVAESLAELLPVSPYRDEVVAAILATYQPGVLHRDAFARLLHRLLPGSGLVIMSADDPRLKRLAAPLFERDIADDTLFAALTKQSAALEDRYHAQVRPRDTNLFYIGDGQRVVIDRTNNGFTCGTSRAWTAAELRQEIADAPDRFSPNVVLRPVMQDTMLPTAAYVAGPGELAYFAQIVPAYDWANVKMPFIMPRASVSLLDNASIRLMSQRDLTLLDLLGRPEQIFAAEVRRDMPARVRDEFGAAKDELNDIVDRLADVAVNIEPTLKRTSEATRTRIVDQAHRLLVKVERAERRKHDELRRRIAHAQGLAFPASGLQERTLSPLYFAARYGMNFFSRLSYRISLDTTSHQVFAASDV